MDASRKVAEARAWFRSSWCEFRHCFYDSGQLGIGEPIEEWQAQKSFGNVLSNRTCSRSPSEPAAHFGDMQRQIVKHTVDSTRFEVANQRLPHGFIRQQKIKQVIRLFAF